MICLEVKFREYTVNSSENTLSTLSPHPWTIQEAKTDDEVMIENICYSVVGHHFRPPPYHSFMYFN